MASGYIYCMSNPSFVPDLLKLGVSERTPDVRRDELHTTGVPTPFVLQFAKFVTNIREKERLLFTILRDKRVSDKREFFRINIEEVISLFMLMDGAWWPNEQSRPMFAMTSPKFSSLTSPITPINPSPSLMLTASPPSTPSQQMPSPPQPDNKSDTSESEHPQTPITDTTGSADQFQRFIANPRNFWIDPNSEAEFLSTGRLRCSICNRTYKGTVDNVNVHSSKKHRPQF
jgi:hypothetical protein